MTSPSLSGHTPTYLEAFIQKPKEEMLALFPRETHSERAAAEGGEAVHGRSPVRSRHRRAERS